jgi:CMP/dCMP kinase
MTYKTKLLNPTESIIVAIDGASATGKGSLAKLMSKQFNLTYCQSSLFYRQLAYNVLDSGIKDDRQKIIDLSSKPLVLRDDVDLYSKEVTEIASKIASIPEVRENLLAPQKQFLKDHKRVIMEGRDIGTVIAPNADLKLFITADIDIRAKRRFEQAGGDNVESVKKALEERDERDTNRSSAPLKQADDAIVIDNSSKSLEEIVRLIVK